MRSAVVIVLILSLGACTRVSTLTASALEHRRTMNDIQARSTLAATCDLSIGSFYRELSDAERAYAALVCGGVYPLYQIPVPSAPPATIFDRLDNGTPLERTAFEAPIPASGH
ncbi:MAG: hypothetical protein ACFB6S_11450 [Geminicoccaceae bacterium]